MSSGSPGPEVPAPKHGGSALRDAARGLRLVWETHRGLTAALAALTLATGLLPAAVAWVGKLVVDGVIRAAQSGTEGDRDRVILWVLVEGGLVMLLAGAQRGIATCQALFKTLLAHRIHAAIIAKSIELPLSLFEDPEVHNRMAQARQEASSRPLGLVMNGFGLLRHGISLASYAALLVQFSGWAVLIVAVAGIPAFLVEARYSRKSFQWARTRTPELRESTYLETLLTREDAAKEIQVFRLGPRLLERFHALFRRIYRRDRELQLRRGAWGFVLSAVASAALYAAYVWIALEAADGRITIGQMVMYFVLLKQAQAAISGGLTSLGLLYEDNLYLSNLYEFLEMQVPAPSGEADAGPDPADGLRFEGVGFTYPGTDRPVLHDVDLHLPRGRKLGLVGENGSGKTTLVKLLMRLYEPTEGRIRFEGRDLREWSPDALRRRIAVIFQDFVRYKFTAGENIGAGDADRFEDEDRWVEAARQGLAHEFVSKLPDGYRTRLGRSFKGGHELSGGQWQKIALSRAYMRDAPDLVVLDEPTAALDAQAEAAVFEHVRDTMAGGTVILISHRLGAVRSVDEILVLSGGRIIERGDHETLMARRGRYASMFEMQAAAYRDAPDDR
jgi:ATP-binding cassette subfamily B protein